MLEIKYCAQCKRRGHLVEKQLVPLLKKEYPDASYEEQCLSFCGPGSMKPFVSVNGTLLYADTEEELMEKVKYHLETTK